MKNFLDVVLILVFATLLVIVLFEWAAGCGESYVDSAGVRHLNECLFIPTPTLERK